MKAMRILSRGHPTNLEVTINELHELITDVDWQSLCCADTEIEIEGWVFPAKNKKWKDAFMRVLSRCPEILAAWRFQDGVAAIGSIDTIDIHAQKFSSRKNLLPCAHDPEAIFKHRQSTTPATALAGDKKKQITIYDVLVPDD